MLVVATAAVAAIAVTVATVTKYYSYKNPRARWPLCRTFVDMHAHLSNKIT